MNIKRIIREELEDGFKDSSQEDWKWAEDALSMNSSVGSETNCDELTVGTKVLVRSNYMGIGAVDEFGVIFDRDRTFGVDYYAIKFDNKFSEHLHGDETRIADPTRSTFWFRCDGLIHGDVVYKVIK